MVSPLEEARLCLFIFSHRLIFYFLESICISSKNDLLRNRFYSDVAILRNRVVFSLLKESNKNFVKNNFTI